MPAEFISELPNASRAKGSRDFAIVSITCDSSFSIAILSVGSALAYTELCENCFADLYRTAVLVTGKPELAAQLVERTCVRGVHACKRMRDVREVKTELTGILFRLCNELSLPYRPGQKGHSEMPAELDSYDRAIIIFRHYSGLKASEFGKATGMPAEYMSSLLVQLRRKIFA